MFLTFILCSQLLFWRNPVEVILLLLLPKGLGSSHENFLVLRILIQMFWLSIVCVIKLLLDHHLFWQVLDAVGWMLLNEKRNRTSAVCLSGFGWVQVLRVVVHIVSIILAVLVEAIIENLIIDFLMDLRAFFCLYNCTNFIVISILILNIKLNFLTVRI